MRIFSNCYNKSSEEPRAVADCGRGKAHQDNYTSKNQLLLSSHINVEGNKTAEATVNDAIHNTTFDRRQTLPLEAACVFIRGNKQTTDVGKGLQYHIGKLKVQSF